MGYTIEMPISPNRAAPRSRTATHPSPRNVARGKIGGKQKTAEALLLPGERSRGRRERCSQEIEEGGGMG
jgi:hypothetical protein